jgi:hypothetical protein
MALHEAVEAVELLTFDMTHHNIIQTKQAMFL